MWDGGLYLLLQLAGTMLQGLLQCWLSEFYAFLAYIVMSILFSRPEGSEVPRVKLHEIKRAGRAQNKRNNVKINSVAGKPGLVTDEAG